MKCPAQVSCVRAISNGAVTTRKTLHEGLVSTDPGSVIQLLSKDPGTIFNRFALRLVRAVPSKRELLAACRTQRVHSGKARKAEVS